jgi:glyoxylase-like metal-dependent hydrolase (beta-lactamase superfamily II)
VPVSTDQREVRPGVFRLGSDLVNSYAVVGGGRLTLVDAGLPKESDVLIAQLDELGFGVGDVEALVLTHSDGDHIGGAARLAGAGVRVLIHRDDVPALRDPGPKPGEASPRHMLRYVLRPGFWRFMGGMARGGGAKPEPVTTAETFGEGEVLDVPGHPRVIHTPGHTPGHVALAFGDAGALMVGDALCTRDPIRGATGPHPMPRGTNVDNAAHITSIAKLAGAEADVVLAGHGDPFEGTPTEASAQALRARRI